MNGLLSERKKYSNELDYRWSKGHDVESWEEKEHEGKHQFYADLCRALFRALSSFGTRGSGMSSQRLRHASAKSVGLHQHRHQLAHIVYLGSCREILEGFEPWFSRADLRSYHLQLGRKSGMRN